MNKATEANMMPILEELNSKGFHSWKSLEEALLGVWNKAHRLEKVVVTSAMPLTEAEKKGFEKRLPHADLQYVVDESLIAGVRIAWNDRILDMSVAGMLESLKLTLSL